MPRERESRQKPFLKGAPLKPLDSKTIVVEGRVYRSYSAHEWLERASELEDQLLPNISSGSNTPDTFSPKRGRP